VPDDRVDDVAAWMEVNPASWITADKLLALRRKMPPFVFERFHLNRWTRAEREWLPRGAWDACLGAFEIPDGAYVTLGVDMARRTDSAALAWDWPHAGKHHVDAMTWAAWPDPEKPAPAVTYPIEGDTIPFEVVMDAIRAACRRWNVYEVAYDPWRFDYPAEVLLSEGIPMVEHPQSPERMAKVSQGLFDAVTEGELVHLGNPHLTTQVQAAVATEVGVKWRLDKSKSRAFMDATVAMAMAVDRGRFYMGAEDADYDFRTI
jgi:phage terminase large subunit-like protein